MSANTYWTFDFPIQTVLNKANEQFFTRPPKSRVLAKATHIREQGTAKSQISNVFKNYDKHLPSARKQTELNIEKFSFDAMKEVIKLELNKLPEFPKQIQLKLPKLTKI